MQYIHTKRSQINSLDHEIAPKISEAALQHLAVDDETWVGEAKRIGCSSQSKWVSQPLILKKITGWILCSWYDRSDPISSLPDSSTRKFLVFLGNSLPTMTKKDCSVHGTCVTAESKKSQIYAILSRIWRGCFRVSSSWRPLAIKFTTKISKTNRRKLTKLAD